jgi:Fe-S-cluster containining protein
LFPAINEEFGEWTDEEISLLKEEYSKCEDKEKFMYRCPFLGENKICTVYEFRALICRVFGLIIRHESGNTTLPFCHSLGLNYSKVYDSETKQIDYEKVKSLGYKEEPDVHKTNLKRLMSPEFFEGEPLNFGEMKSLIDWL